MTKTKYLIIGNGIAGLAAAKEIRNNDQEGSILIVSNEPYLTYYRVKLTECLSKEFQDRQILVNKESWYEENKIKVILSKIVEKLDVDNNKVILDDGKKIEYEKLLLATGSRPFIPAVAGKFKQGVLALRTLRDLKYIKDYFSKCEEVAIIGGGLLGLEAAWSLKSLGKKVTIIELAPYLLSKQLDEELAYKLEHKLKQHGFEIFLSSSVEEILGENRAKGIRLNNGKVIKTDGILFSVGIIPNIDIVRDTEIQFNRGIIVDNNLKTNIDNIYAAGDVIEIDGRILGLWTVSNEQGKVAGANMTGQYMEYKEPKLFTSLQLEDIKLFSIGDIKDFHKVYEYKDKSKGIHHKLFVKDGKVTGGILFGDVKDMGKLRNGVINNVTIEEYTKNNINFK